MGNCFPKGFSLIYHEEFRLEKDLRCAKERALFLFSIMMLEETMRSHLSEFDLIYPVVHSWEICHKFSYLRSMCTCVTLSDLRGALSDS